jgi:hypothetical protein
MLISSFQILITSAKPIFPNNLAFIGSVGQDQTLWGQAASSLTELPTNMCPRHHLLKAVTGAFTESSLEAVVPTRAAYSNHLGCLIRIHYSDPHPQRLQSYCLGCVCF